MAGSYIALGFNRSEARAAVGTGYVDFNMLERPMAATIAG
jgi:hypothetical protein